MSPYAVLALTRTGILKGFNIHYSNKLVINFIWGCIINIILIKPTNSYLTTWTAGNDRYVLVMPCAQPIQNKKSNRVVCACATILYCPYSPKELWLMKAWWVSHGRAPARIFFGLCWSRWYVNAVEITFPISELRWQVRGSICNVPNGFQQLERNL